MMHSKSNPSDVLDPSIDFKPIGPPMPGDWRAEHYVASQPFALFAPNAILPLPSSSFSTSSSTSSSSKASATKPKAEAQHAVAKHQRGRESNDKRKVDHKRQHTIGLVQLGSFEQGAPDIELLRQCCAAFFWGMDVKLSAHMTLDSKITCRKHEGRRQLLTTDILALLKQRKPPSMYALCAVTMQDLYPKPSWNFVFGQASLDSGVGVFSFARHDPAFYLPPTLKPKPKIGLKHKHKPKNPPDHKHISSPKAEEREKGDAKEEGEYIEREKEDKEKEEGNQSRKQEKESAIAEQQRRDEKGTVQTVRNPEEEEEACEEEEEEEEREERERSTLILRRACKTLVHEITHMFGITHCLYMNCVMNGSNHLDESDSRDIFLCPVCLRKLQYCIGFSHMERYAQLLAFFEKAGLRTEHEWLNTHMRHVKEEVVRREAGKEQRE